MPVDVVLPELGESITEAILVEWLKADGDAVAVDEPIALIETDKADVELPAPAGGVLKRLKSDGDTIRVGEAVGAIDESGISAPKADAQAERSDAAESEPESKVASGPEADALSPAVRRLVTEHGLDASKIEGTGKGGQLIKGDVLAYLEAQKEAPPEAKEAPKSKAAPKPEGKPQAQPKPEPAPAPSGDGTRRVPMSKIRQRIAQRLVAAQQNAAMLTTFNEADMTGIFALRTKYKERFADVHGVSLGLMSFFVRACAMALQEFPDVNASLDGTDVVYHDDVHMGIAVSTDRGLVVPVMRRADRMSFAQIESEIKRVATSAREGKLGLDELSGGTFTITNGGIFGSMLSTPILNTPQTGILGMHAIQKRPVAVGDQVEIRPMMYLALTYDHRLIDGQTSVKFLVRVKELLEDPARMMLSV